MRMHDNEAGPTLAQLSATLVVLLVALGQQVVAHEEQQSGSTGPTVGVLRDWVGSIWHPARRHYPLPGTANPLPRYPRYPPLSG